MYLLKTLYNLLKFIENLISPSYCISCREFIKFSTIFCKDCFSRVEFVPVYNLKINNNLEIPVYAISDYKNPLKTLIISKHYSNYLYSIDLGKLIYLYTIISKLDFDYLVPIPLYWSKYYYRGYNQAEVMAKEVSRLTNKPVISILKRIKYNESRDYLNKKINHSGLIFELTKNAKKYRGKRIVLIDDLMVTGSTIKSACIALDIIRPKKIYAFVACRIL